MGETTSVGLLLGDIQSQPTPDGGGGGAGTVSHRELVVSLAMVV